MKASTRIAGLAATLAAIYVALGQKPKAEALRDRVVKGHGDKGAEVKALMEQAISSAEAEAKPCERAAVETDGLHAGSPYGIAVRYSSNFAWPDTAVQ